MSLYRFTIEGTAGDGQSWTTSGPVSGDFPKVLEDAMYASFEQLTKGKAVYGRPGVGCRGPYKIRTFTLTAGDS